MKEIPSWVVYPDFDRVRWLNDVLKEIFPHLQRGITTLVQGTVDPMLDKMKPIFLRTLGIRVSRLFVGAHGASPGLRCGGYARVYRESEGSYVLLSEDWFASVQF